MRARARALQARAALAAAARGGLLLEAADVQMADGEAHDTREQCLGVHVDVAMPGHVRRDDDEARVCQASRLADGEALAASTSGRSRHGERGRREAARVRDRDGEPEEEHAASSRS